MEATCLDLEKMIWEARRLDLNIASFARKVGRSKAAVFKLTLQLIPALEEEELITLAVRAKIIDEEKLFQKCLQELEKRAKTH